MIRLKAILWGPLLALPVTFATPASATPADTHPTAASAQWGSGCYVTDAAGVTTFIASCPYHLQEQTDTNGNLISAMYHDHTQLPAGATLPTSTISRDISFSDVRCTERITPSGDYSSECYFQSRSKAYP